MITIDERVEAGAAWLDANRPGWWQRINLDTLDLGDECKCTLGQLYGNFHKAPDDVVEATKSVEHGFDVMMIRRTSEEVAEEIGALTAAWRTLIQARRAEVAT